MLKQQCRKAFIAMLPGAFLSAALFFPAQAAAAPVFNGILDTTVTGAVWDGRPFTFGVEEYLNLRMQARVGGAAQVFGAFNFIAFAGQNVPAPFPGNAAGTVGDAGFTAGDNFVSSIELERLYLRLTGEALGLDAGLLRQAFGFGAVWAPSDFLNPRNPLIPDARPRAVLAAVFSWFPNDTAKTLVFAAAPKQALNNGEGKGALAGLSAEIHNDTFSMQGLYGYETPKDDSGGVLYNAGVHRAGISVKADIKADFYADILYTLNPADMADMTAAKALDGLAATAGLDYSFAPREPKAYFQAFVVAAEYLYNGQKSQTAAGYGGGYSKRHYLSPSLSYLATNYTKIVVSAVIGLEDASFIPIAVFSQTLAQGLTLTVTGQFYPAASGEFGRDGIIVSNRITALTLKLQARF